MSRRLKAAIWEVWAQSLPMSILTCFVLSMVSMVAGPLLASSSLAQVSRSSYFPLALFALANAGMLHSSTKYGARRIWPLGMATFLGIAGGAWMLSEIWQKSRQPGMFHPGPWVVIEAVALLGGWIVVVLLVARFR